MVLPLLKVGILVVKQAIKPVAHTIKDYAKEHPRFRAASVAFAQWWHRVEVRVAVRLLGHEPREIKPLEEVPAAAGEFWGRCAGRKAGRYHGLNGVLGLTGGRWDGG